MAHWMNYHLLPLADPITMAHWFFLHALGQRMVTLSFTGGHRSLVGTPHYMAGSLTCGTSWLPGPETASYENWGGSYRARREKTFGGGIPHFRKRPIGFFYVGKAKMETYHPQIDHLDISKVSGMKHQSIWVVCGIAFPTLAHLQLGYKPCISHGNITCNWGVL